MRVLFAVEGTTDVPFAERIIESVGRVPHLVLVAGGKPNLDSQLARWSQPSNRMPFLVLRDWDASDRAACVPEHVTKLLGGHTPPPTFVLRIPVRATEAWLMADRGAAVSYFGTDRIPVAPDDELSPKRTLVNACRASKSKRIRDAMVPTEGGRRSAGPLYEPTVVDFGRNRWDPQRARTNSPSLDRSLRRIESLVLSGSW
jgi:hypothetical protein